ncbi:protein CASC1 [Lingula anatina]|uniref:Protein CASC1 n=1 Tax=Lingula anatina TaxID=7574 RepID=A0A1S3HI13_LINAN|nr:protein CASC1 [Lingula anatina]|eukprot:XP_013385748.1 protein CASC1 [Lingula anatina]
MPPKTPGSGKKMSKAEKEKLKKEEEERKAKEEEEERIRAEEEAAAQKERNKAEAAEKRRLEQEERARRATQLEDLNNILETNKATLDNIENERRKNAKWQRYMLCDGSPDPTIPGEINTYMNLWKEDSTRVQIEDVLVDSKQVLALISELEFLLEDTPAENIMDQEVNQFKATMSAMQTLLKEKLDRASHELLLRASELANPDTSNLEACYGDDMCTLCVWGNLSKNPRIKSFEFKEKGFQFELPKILTLSDCAVRLLHSKYDHLSYTTRSYTPRLKKTEEPEVEEAPPEQEEEKAEEGEKPEGEEKEEDEEDMEREKTEDLMAALRSGNIDGDDEEEKQDEKKDDEPEEEELPPEEDAKTPEPLVWEDFDDEDDVVDLRAYTPLGGVFNFNLLHLPPQPKSVKGWIMTTLVEPVLNPMDYVADNASAVPTPNKEEENKDKKDDQKEKKEEKPPIAISMRLPQDVYFCEEPQVARWDAPTKTWRLEGFSDNNYNEETKMLTFKTNYFTTFGLFQDSHVNMPFQSWEIRPRGMNKALFTLIAAIVELEIEIEEDKCCLGKPDDKPELQHLLNKWMSPQDLIKALKAAGINIFPAEDSSKYVSIQNKHPVTESNLYQQMAITASSMAYSWSKWNAEVADRDKIIIQGAECMKDEPLLEEDWGLFMATKKRTIKLKMSEFDEEFSDDHADGTNYHADLYHLVMEALSAEGQQKIKDTNYKFYNTVSTMLSATKVLTYA